MQKVLRLEIIRNGLVVASDNFVNLLLPAGLHVPAGAYRGKKFSQRDLDHGEVVVRNLENQGPRVTKQVRYTTTETKKNLKNIVIQLLYAVQNIDRNKAG